MLVEDFVNPMQITQGELGDALYVPYQRIYELVEQKRGVTSSTALRLGRFYGVSPDSRLDLPVRGELYKAQQSERYALADTGIIYIPKMA